MPLPHWPLPPEMLPIRAMRFALTMVPSSRASLVHTRMPLSAMSRTSLPVMRRPLLSSANIALESPFSKTLPSISPLQPLRRSSALAPLRKAQREIDSSRASSNVTSAPASGGAAMRPSKTMPEIETARAPAPETMGPPESPARTVWPRAPARRAPSARVMALAAYSPGPRNSVCPRAAPSRRAAEIAGPWSRPASGTMPRLAASTTGP